MGGRRGVEAERRDDSGGSMNVKAESNVVAALDRVEKTGQLDGVSIEYWIGGGLPPPYYRSDQFRLFQDAGEAVIQFVRRRHDENVKPPDFLERFRMKSNPTVVRTIAARIRETGAFRRPLPDEGRSEASDRLRTELGITISGEEHLLVFDGPAPPSLDPLRVEIERLTELLLKSGRRTVQAVSD
jgi:hypothetical protein